MNERARWIADHILPYEPEVRAWLRRRLPQSIDVDDVVQEAYAALAALKEVSHVGNPRAYFFATAQSVVLQQVRRARIVSFETVAELDRLEAACDSIDPERNAVAGEELRRLASLVRSLPGQCRKAFLLRKVEGLPQREIAQRMGLSENTVEKHIGKALRLLMEQMKGDARGERTDAADGQPQRSIRHERHEEH